MVCAFSFYTSFSLIFTYVSLASLGLVLLLKSTDVARKLFLTAFAVYIICAVLLATLFTLEHGNPFIGGGDDEIFYHITRDYKNGLPELADGKLWPAITYKAYIITQAAWLRVLNTVGFTDDHFFHLNMLNSFFGAMSVVLIYLSFKKITDEPRARKIIFWVMIFPPLIFYSATIIRDTAALLVFAFVFYIMVATSWPGIIKLALVGFCAFIMYHLRDASAVFLMVFVLVYMLMGVGPADVRSAFKLLLLGGVLGILAMLVIAAGIIPPKDLPPTTDIMDFLSFRIRYYNDEILREASAGSLGVRLRDFSNPLLLTGGIVYTYFSPLPPMFFYGANAANIFLGVGNLMWYFCATAFLCSMLAISRGKRFHRAWWGIMMTLLLALLIVHFSSGDARHLIFIQPFLVGFGVAYVQENKRFFLPIVVFLTLTALLFGLIYLGLKFS